MPEEFIQDENTSAEDTSIDPRDTYGSRFQVKSRSVGTRLPRSAITQGQRRIKDSEKIFTKRHDHSSRGGSVNMKNINTEEQAPAAEPDKLADEELRSSGLDSLFSSTASEKSSTVKPVKKQKKASVKPAYSEASTSERNLKVIKPVSYNSAASDVSSALKAGCAVVICLKNTSEEVSKRLLDFAFGAAAMCGARVSLEAERTYVITIGPGLSQREKLLCVKEGVALKVEN